MLAKRRRRRFNNQNTLILLLIRLPLQAPTRFLPKRSACQPINVKQRD
jgi:hypothetical protein